MCKCSYHHCFAVTLHGSDWRVRKPLQAASSVVSGPEVRCVLCPKNCKSKRDNMGKQWNTWENT